MDFRIRTRQFLLAPAVVSLNTAAACKTPEEVTGTGGRELPGTSTVSDDFSCLISGLPAAAGTAAGTLPVPEAVLDASTLAAAD